MVCFCDPIWVTFVCLLWNNKQKLKKINKLVRSLVNLQMRLQTMLVTRGFEKHSINELKYEIKNYLGHKAFEKCTPENLQIFIN